MNTSSTIKRQLQKEVDALDEKYKLLKVAQPHMLLKEDPYSNNSYGS